MLCAYKYAVVIEEYFQKEADSGNICGPFPPIWLPSYTSTGWSYPREMANRKMAYHHRPIIPKGFKCE